MKKMIITILILCGFSHASDNSLKLPLYYDPITNFITELTVDLRQIDRFTQSNFQTLIKKAFETEGHGYNITVFRCMNLAGDFEYSVADTKAFNLWIAANGKVEPVTKRPIAHNSSQNFIIEPAEPGRGYRYEVFKAAFTRYASSGEKRKRETKAEDDAAVESVFKKIQADKELRRAKELAFLKEHD